jgi:hypothetical protein
MPRFTINAPGRSEPVSELIANDPGSVLAIMFRIGCREADISKDGAYTFSARLDGNEVWSIFDRHGRGRDVDEVPAAGVSRPFFVVS